MKRFVSALAALCMLLTLFACPADAAVSATPNQKLAFRTGPNTKYVDMHTLPQSTSLTAIEYEEGNGVTWVLVEFLDQGRYVRGFARLDGVTVVGEVPPAVNAYRCAAGLTADSIVYAAPKDSAAVHTYLPEDVTVWVLDFVENGYAYIEFAGLTSGLLDRGYVQIDRIAIP